MTARRVLLHSAEGASKATISPDRGAHLLTLDVRGAAVLAHNERSFEDPTQSIRGGVPLLFPMAGRLPEDSFPEIGTRMPQHGFARNRAWTVLEQRGDFLSLELRPDAGSRAQFPFEFRLQHDFRMLPDGIALTWRIENHSPRPLPACPGWHPYFPIRNEAMMQVQRLTGPWDASRLTPEASFDFGVPAADDGVEEFTIPGVGRLRFEFSHAMRHVQVWSPGRAPYICLEPFWGGAPTILDPSRRLNVPAGGAVDLFFHLRLPKE